MELLREAPLSAEQPPGTADTMLLAEQLAQQLAGCKPPASSVMCEWRQKGRQRLERYILKVKKATPNPECC